MEIHRLPPIVYEGPRHTVASATRLADGRLEVTIIDRETDETRKVIDTTKGILTQIPGDPFQQKILRGRLEQL